MSNQPCWHDRYRRLGGSRPAFLTAASAFGAGALVGLVCYSPTAAASDLVPQTALPGDCIPKFAVPMPVFGPAGSIPRVDAVHNRCFR